MRSRIRRLFSVSHRDVFWPGLANFRVALFLYGIVGVMLSLWLYVWCVISCPREVEREVSLPSGRNVPIFFVLHGSDSSWIEYASHTGGEPEAVRAEVAELLETLHSSSDFPSDPRRLEVRAVRVKIRIWGWYGPFPDVRCCTETVVVINPDGEDERIFETISDAGGHTPFQRWPYNIAFERTWPFSSASI